MSGRTAGGARRESTGRVPFGLGMTLALAGLMAVTSLGACKSVETPEVSKDYARPLPEGSPGLEKITDPGELPDFRPLFEDRDASLAAIAESESFFAVPSSQKWFPYALPDRELTHSDQIETLSALERILESSRNAEELHGWCLLAFDVYRSVGWDGSGEVLFTAYCEPIFKGSFEPEGPFRYPLYGLPDDLVKAEDGTPRGRRTEDGRIVPYYTREEIETLDLLAGKELVYLRDPFEVYIAQVQGSARIELPDGRELNVGYAGKTDHPYTSIGQSLVKEGKIPSHELSLARLKRYFRENPREITRVLRRNASYVFFVEREPGPFGSIGRKVTPYRTVATDKSVFPRGGPTVATVSLPEEDAAGGLSRRPRTLLLLDQDTGGAIRSAGRADVFVGTGPKAERIAGFTREEGRLYYLFLKEGALLP